MGITTAIEWTDATWNPVRGCSRVSEGCRNCYAERQAFRFSNPGQPFEGLVWMDSGGDRRPRWNGTVLFVDLHLLDPLGWRRGRRVFVNSMSDLFHEQVTDAMCDKIFAVMALAPQHTFQVLTKRPERMRGYLSDAATWPRIVAAMEWVAGERGWSNDALRPELVQALLAGLPLPNVWLGVSVEDQKTANARIPLLLQTPAAVRFLSAEPLLGPVDLDDLTQESVFYISHVSCLQCGVDSKDDPEFQGATLDWVIAGGESGPRARPMHPGWVRRLRDQCAAAGVPFFFKQWGEWAHQLPFARYQEIEDATFIAIDGRTARAAEGLRGREWQSVWRVGKKAAGHLLDGVEHHAFPEVRA